MEHNKTISIRFTPKFTFVTKHNETMKSLIEAKYTKWDIINTMLFPISWRKTIFYLCNPETFLQRQNKQLSLRILALVLLITWNLYFIKLYGTLAYIISLLKKSVLMSIICNIMLSTYYWCNNNNLIKHLTFVT